MKKSKIMRYFLMVFTLVISNTIHAQTKELDCLKEYNSFIEKKLKQNCCKYEAIKDSLTFILQAKVTADGKFTSLKVKKSNLSRYGINENRVLSKLSKYKLKCLYNVYYNEEMKPDNVVLIFNPNLR